jgi:DNA-binding FadR family transcriptional regulator
VREALRELESGGLLERRPGSKLMTVSRPQHRAIAKDVSRALALHDVTFFEVWEALTQLEPPIAEIAARNRTAADLDCIRAACAQFAQRSTDTEKTVHHAAEFFRCVGRATHNQVLALAQEPLLDLLEPSLRVLIDKVPQARSRIATAQQRIHEAIAERDLEAARGWMVKHIRDFRKGYELADIALDCRIP